MVDRNTTERIRATSELGFTTRMGKSHQEADLRQRALHGQQRPPPQSREQGLVQPVTDDGHFKTRVFESIDVVQLKLGRLHVQFVIASCDDRRHR